MRQIDRRTVLMAGAAAALSTPFALSAASSASPLTGPSGAALADPQVAGSWSPPFDLGGVAVHAMLTHIGQVLFFQYVEGKPTEDHTSHVATWHHGTGAIQEAMVPYDRDLFCCGNNFLPDGRLFAAGGHDYHGGRRFDAVGVKDADIYDPVGRTWVPRQPLSLNRWYPTNVGLPNGRTLIFGGWDTVGYNSEAVDEYNPVTNTMRQLPPSATKNLGNYPRLHLLPNGTLVKTGTAQRSASFNLATNSWSNLGSMASGSRQFGLSVLLPDCTRVMAVGGRPAPNAAPTPTIEILDTTAPSPKWRYTTPIGTPRLHANGVHLPDGQVLIVGGCTTGTETGPIKTPELYDPVAENWTAQAPHLASRMYHSTALLLPDGRVFSAGGENPNTAEQQSAEIFSPPYLFKGARPTITTSPTSIGYGGSMVIKTPNAADIAKVTLIKASAVTHQVDTDQRSVPLAFVKNRGNVAAQMPNNPNLTPPGYYMLFIVNNAGVPSVAPWVRVG